MAALLWLRPELGATQKSALPLSVAALRGWAKLELSYLQLRKTSSQALTAIRAAPLKASLHSLRHGGASHDRQTNARSWQSVQQRGNWKAHASVHRYEKHGLLAKELQKLPRKVVENANAATRRLLLCYAELFKMPSGLRQASTKSLSTCFQAPGASQPLCDAKGMPASSSTSYVARTLTLRGQLSTARCGAGSTRTL